LVRLKAKLMINEDARRSRFCHSKLMVIEKVICFITITIFFLSCVKTEVDIAKGAVDSNNAKAIMLALSTCIGALVLVLVIRSVSLY
jgi:hypothetical protein